MYAKIKNLAYTIRGRLSKKQWVLVGSSAVLLLCLGATFIPLPVEYSYSNESCRARLVVLPSLLKSPGSSSFSIVHKGGMSIGGIQIVSTKSCFVAESEPKEGTYYQRNSLVWFVFAYMYRVDVPSPPKLRVAQEQANIAIAKPLKYQLEHPDIVHEYFIARGSDRRQKCAANGPEVQCYINHLDLAQGSEYELLLSRSFKSKPPVAISKSRVVILPAVVVTGQSIQPEETVYSAPKQIELTVDKPLVSARAELFELNGDASTVIPSSLSTKDTTITLALQSALAREKTFKVVVHSAESQDGTTLAETYSFSFTTSGGPKVSTVNIGSNGVSLLADVRIVFDQALARGQNINQFVRIEGAQGAATYSGKDLHIRLSGDRCAAFTIFVDKGLVGENGVTAKDSWRHSSRFNCRSSSVIGYSVNGRPITAYYYGSGGTTILFTGGIHGTEASGSYILKDWIAHLDANAYKIPAGRQVVVIPDANPDGLAAGTRDNARGVNIDRNFPTANWKTDINSANGYRPGGGGPTPASEPETQALMKITNQLRPRLEVSYHAQGRIVGASACAASAAVAHSYAAGVRYGTMIGTAEEVMGYELTGEYEEWICEAFGTPAILIELPTRTGRFFSSHLNTMWQMVNY